MSTGCEFYTDALADLAAGRLGRERAGRVEAHLASCSDCREALDVIRTLRAAPLEVPDRLEARIRRAVRTGGAPATGPADPADPGRHGSPKAVRHGRRRWALPLAAAAGLAAALGIGQLVAPPGGPADELEVTAEYDPYGAWPGSDGVVAGEPVLSDLTVEELEALLEELES